MAPSVKYVFDTNLEVRDVDGAILIEAPLGRFLMSGKGAATALKRLQAEFANARAYDDFAKTLSPNERDRIRPIFEELVNRRVLVERYPVKGLSKRAMRYTEFLKNFVSRPDNCYREFCEKAILISGIGAGVDVFVQGAAEVGLRNIFISPWGANELASQSLSGGKPVPVHRFEEGIGRVAAGFLVFDGIPRPSEIVQSLIGAAEQNVPVYCCAMTSNGTFIAPISEKGGVSCALCFFASAALKPTGRMAIADRLASYASACLVINDWMIRHAAPTRSRLTGKAFRLDQDLSTVTEHVVPRAPDCPFCNRYGSGELLIPLSGAFDPVVGMLEDLSAGLAQEPLAACCIAVRRRGRRSGKRFWGFGLLPAEARSCATGLAIASLVSEACGQGDDYAMVGFRPAEAKLRAIVHALDRAEFEQQSLLPLPCDDRVNFFAGLAVDLDPIHLTSIGPFFKATVGKTGSAMRLSASEAVCAAIGKAWAHRRANGEIADIILDGEDSNDGLLADYQVALASIGLSCSFEEQPLTQLVPLSSTHFYKARIERRP
ncbi:hypothetical protein ACC794_02955 [Rhizobium ruizarguesonis]